VNCEDPVDLRNVFTVLKPIGEHAKCESFCPCDSFVATGAIREHTGKRGNFANPTAVCFPFDLDREVAHA